jgi:hypothetical protein
MTPAPGERPRERGKVAPDGREHSRGLLVMARVSHQPRAGRAPCLGASARLASVLIG